MRGKLKNRLFRGIGTGSIPACAGETTPAVFRQADAEVYPRVCGGNIRKVDPAVRHHGLSPRVRGKPAAWIPELHLRGSIPACAGETNTAGVSCCGKPVYPRVCGGNSVSGQLREVVHGLSPRVRGKRRPMRHRPSRCRSIPACAGETAGGGGRNCPSGVYPRVCGGNPKYIFPAHLVKGLSPRVRGKHRGEMARRDPRGSIPACAGETYLGLKAWLGMAVYPRVCGGNPNVLHAWTSGEGLSPRVRGKRCYRVSNWRMARSIPACAGETFATRCTLRAWGVYPRVCGGNVSPLLF